MALDARLIKCTDEDFFKTNQLLVKQIFEEKEYITYQDLEKLQQDFKMDLWHFEFHKCEPNEKGRISIKSFLQSNIHTLSGHHIEKFLKQIDKIAEAYEDHEGLTYQQFITFQHFLENLELIKMNIQKYRVIDYITWLEIIDTFCKTNQYCTEHKVELPEDIPKALFLLFDLDESGEIEPSEIALFDRRLLAVSKEEKAKDDLKILVAKQAFRFKTWFKETTGLF